ncbi:F-box/LRR-repeat/kelch-repeat protein [Cardamine amara subsp. amara]|uniref:F-box/LRR-repeat/kelch-repeat protein n=1 Tax=Cardamine amara subsp. amara TaxID=228776 RepID=A0ABD1AJ50_CARAN
MVVNPCTGQTRWIEPISNYNMYDRFALGYTNNNNKLYKSYKILRLPYEWNQLEIFELKSNSWRVVANTPPNKDLHTYGRGMYSLKGNAYWISYVPFHFDILSFDFLTERFRRLCLPFQRLG